MRRRPPGPGLDATDHGSADPGVKTFDHRAGVLLLPSTSSSARRGRRSRAHLAIGPGLFAGEVWQPLTSLFVNSTSLGFVFSVIGLRSSAAFSSATQGTRRFLLLFFVIAGVLANLASPAGSGACAATVADPVRRRPLRSPSWRCSSRSGASMVARQAQLWARPFPCRHGTWSLILRRLVRGGALARGDWAATSPRWRWRRRSAYLGGGGRAGWEACGQLSRRAGCGRRTRCSRAAASP